MDTKTNKKKGELKMCHMLDWDKCFELPIAKLLMGMFSTENMQQVEVQWFSLPFFMALKWPVAFCKNWPKATKISGKMPEFTSLNFEMGFGSSEQSKLCFYSSIQPGKTMNICLHETSGVFRRNLVTIFKSGRDYKNELRQRDFLEPECWHHSKAGE